MMRQPAFTRRAAVAASAAVAWVASACRAQPTGLPSDPGGTGREDAAGRGAAPATAPPTTRKPVQVTVNPADGATGVPLNTQVTVAVADGTLKSVVVAPAPPGSTSGSTASTTASGDGTAGSSTSAPSTTSTTKAKTSGTTTTVAPLTGNLTGNNWTSSSGLKDATTYRVTVEGVDSGGEAFTKEHIFTTLKAAKVFTMAIAPLPDDKVGVGHPIALYLKFDLPKAKRAEFLQRLVVTSEPSQPGAWRWFSDDEVHYRPPNPWASGTKVKLEANVAGFEVGDGAWFTDNRLLNFTIGPARMSTVDVNAHTMTCTENGQVVKTMPVSTGKASNPTQGGWHMVMEKAASIVMDSSTTGTPVNAPGGYRITAQWNVRLSNSGEFVHAAPWSVNSQGRANVSNGCINASVDNAKWFYNFSQRGDLVNVIGSPKPLKLEDGFSDWNIEWSQWPN